MRAINFSIKVYGDEIEKAIGFSKNLFRREVRPELQARRDAKPSERKKMKAARAAVFRRRREERHKLNEQARAARTRRSQRQPADHMIEGQVTARKAA